MGSGIALSLIHKVNQILTDTVALADKDNFIIPRFDKIALCFKEVFLKQTHYSVNLLLRPFPVFC